LRNIALGRYGFHRSMPQTFMRGSYKINQSLRIRERVEDQVMPRAEPTKRGRLPIWRTAGLSLVLLAITLAAISLVLALLHAQRLTTQLIQQAQPQTRQLADTILSLFVEQAKSGLRWVSDETRIPTDHPPWLHGELPTWMDGLYVWDGTVLTVLVPPDAFPSETADRVQALLAMRPVVPGTLGDMNRLEMVHDRSGSLEIVLVWLRTRGPLGEPVLVACNVSLDRLKRDLADPLLAIHRGLEIVRTQDATATWSQPMSRALRFWSIQPTRSFLVEQKDAVMWQTLGHISLTVLSLLTLLTAIWFLLRVTRRELALAEMKSNFVADVSHELKTPLALIHLFSETLQSGRVTDENKRQEYYSIITRESTRLTNLIDNILNFARIDAGEKEYSFKFIDVAEIVSDIYKSYRLELDNDCFEHHLVVQHELPKVQADRDAIAQAVLNLISNAIKYSKDERYLLLDVRTETRRDRRGVLISVHDHGIGITPEDRAHLFDGFFRSSDSRVREKRGTGIGLSLVRRIVDAHDGFLVVESRLVKGSTFRIFLPAAPAQTTEEDEPDRDA